MTSAADIKTIFGRTLEIASPSERSAFLGQACVGNDSLRRDVEGLLAAAEQAGSFLQRSVQDENCVQPTILEAALTERPGMVIGPYKLLQQIGEGGFGVVFLAEQERPVRRTVALKVIKPGMDSREVIARFEAERQALALMDHQNIARVLDAGATEAGRPYFVMELVKGIPITEYCNANKLTLRERLELFVPVCQAIQHAHQKGVIHRDIKPSNVLVCLYDGRPVPKVIDFGVAKAIEQRLTDKTMFTRYGQVVGTLEYMSPEQAELSQLDIDTRSDIYSLGVLLYELLTGTTPITKDQLRKAGFSEMLRMIRETEPERPSMRLSRSHETLASISAQRRTEPAKLGAILKGELDWLVMKALEKDRTRRYETANGLARDIERYLHDEPVEACPPSMRYRLSKLVRRHRRSVWAGSAFAALLFVLLTNFVVSYFKLQKARREGAAETRRALQAEQEALQNLDSARKQQARAEAAEQDAFAQRQLEFNARNHAVQALVRSQFEQAHALRLAAQPGRRWNSLGLLGQAFELHRQLQRGERGSVETQLSASAAADLPAVAELRTEAVAALLLQDGRVAREWPGFTHSVSPDGKFAMTFGVGANFQDLTATLTELSSGKTVREWKGREAERFFGMFPALSPNAEYLAIQSPTLQDIKIWRLSDTTLLRTVTMPVASEPTSGAEKTPLRTVPLRQMSFSPDGGFLVAAQIRAAGDCAIALFEVADGAASRIVATSKMPTTTVAFSQDSRRLVFLSDFQKGTIWDLDADRALTEFDVPLKPDGCVGFDPTGTLVALHGMKGGTQSQLLLWDIAQKREIARLDTGSIAAIAPLHFSADGRHVAVAGSSGAVIVVDVQPSQRFGDSSPLRLDHGSLPQVLAWSANGQLLTGGLAGLKQWEFATPDALSTLPLQAGKSFGRLSNFAFSPDGEWIAVEPWPETVVVLFDRSGKKVRSWNAGTTFNSGVVLRFSPDSTRLVRHSPNGVTVWNVESDEKVGQIDTTISGMNSAPTLGFRADGRVLATGMEGKKAILRDVLTGKTFWESAASGTMAPVVVTPNGRLAVTYRGLALGGGDSSITVWDLENNRERFLIPGAEDKLAQTMVDVSPGSQWVLAIHFGGAIAGRAKRSARHINESPSTAAVAPALGPVRLSFGAGPANMLSSDQEWIGEIWNLETGQRHAQIEGPSAMDSSAFSPDGRYLAIRMRNGKVRLWEVNAGEEHFDWTPLSGPADGGFSPR